MDIERFLNHYSGLSELTQIAYRNTLNMLERRISGDEPTDEDVREFLREFKVGTTLQRHKAAIKRYFIFKQRPWTFDSKEFAAARKKLPHYLRREQVEQLIEQAKDEHDRMFVKTLFLTGIRIAELMSLTGESIEPDGIKFIGKRNKERFVPILDKSFMRELQDYAKRCKGRLFPKKYWDYWLNLRRLCLEVGMPMVSPHTLRHSRAVDLVERGVSLGGVQTFLGHEQPGTTLIYAQLTQKDLRKELERAEG
ncbi:Tyrosine recombinase XerD [subsurface metagenome]